MDDKETYSLEGNVFCGFINIKHNQSVTIFVDNMNMVQCINSGKSKDPAIMGLIRALYYYISISC